MLKNPLITLVLGGILRFYLLTTDVAIKVGRRVEISTPLNSLKKVQEGIYLYQHGINPYQGDIVHEIPIILRGFIGIFITIPQLVPLTFIILDLFTAWLLYKLSQEFICQKHSKEKKLLQNYASGTEELQLQTTDIEIIPYWVLLTYMFNPLSILNCIGLSTTAFSNFFLALTLFCLVKRSLLPCVFFLAIETMRNLYPVVLIAPIIIVFANKSLSKAIIIVALFIASCMGISWLNASIMNSWSFLDNTLGFIFFYRDLQPNIGLFWYFFTEMFEHFRTMFLITFQINATILYLIPLSLKLREEPFFLAYVLVCLMSIFRSYPCLGDIGFYISLLPLWRRCFKFMAHNFVVFGFFLVTLSMMPALWHLWIYAGSANANFYFGTSLAFCTGQIFLITDLLFARVKHNFCLYNGQKIYIDGKEAKILLE